MVTLNADPQPKSFVFTYCERRSSQLALCYVHKRLKNINYPFCVFGRAIALLCVITIASGGYAEGTVTLEPTSDSYSFVSHHRIEIKAPTSEVWEHLVELGSWMYEFELSHVAGPKGQVGQVLRLYPGQEFYVQITKAEPGQVLVIANLPSNFKEEESTGIGVMTLNESPTGTIVDLTMSRRYDWLGKGKNPSLEVRRSEEFKTNTDAMWGRFLGRLNSLAVDT